MWECGEGYAFGVGIYGLEFYELEEYVFRRGRGFWVRSIMRVRGYVISVERYAMRS